MMRVSDLWLVVMVAGIVLLHATVALWHASDKGWLLAIILALLQGVFSAAAGVGAARFLEGRGW